jgi:hypothetical protein
MSLRLSTGLRNALVARSGLAHAALVGATGDFVDGGGSNDSITDSGNSLITKGFEIGDWIQTFAPTTDPGNVFSAKLLAVAAGEMEFITGTVGAVEVFAALTAVVAAKGGSLADIFKHGVIHIYSDDQPLTADLTEPGTKRLEITDNKQTQNTGTGLNGLEFEDDPSSGILAKLSTQTWKGEGLNTGTIGWFRFYDQAVNIGASSTAIRFDGSVALSGAQLNVASLDVTATVDFIINSFNMIVPAS